MTNKEAINALKLEGGLEISGKPKRMAEFMEALSVAVEALGSLDEARDRAKKAEKHLLEITGNGCVPGRVKLVTEEYLSLLSERKILKKKLNNAERIIAELASTADRNSITTCFGHPIERVLELVKADRDGRCYIANVKIGERIFVPDKDGKIAGCRVQGISLPAHGKNLILHLGGYPAEYLWSDREGIDWWKSYESAEAALKKEGTNHGMDQR